MFHADEHLLKESLFHWFQWENSLLHYWEDMHLNAARTPLSQGVIFEGLSGIVTGGVTSEENIRRY